MMMRRNEMNVAMVERGCADCALWVKLNVCLEGQEEDVRENPEEAAERQIEQIERVFGLEWKW
jgi:hypothetical protein